ncbi:MAG: IPTL-CTERM sorting domain-containing protein [Casimicrobiaceae bacterium]
MTPAALAQVLYGATGAGGSAAATLYVLDPATGGVVSTIGPIGFPVTGLAVHPTTGVLYGTTGIEIGTPSLIRINTTTGAGTLIGANSCGPIADISFRTDGTLFGWSQCNQGDLVTINLSTGVEAVVGLSGISPKTQGSGLAFSPGGTLFFTGSSSNGALRTINPATGAPTTVATLNGAPAVQPINALAFSAGGVLYGSLRGFPAGSLITIDTSTGLVTNIGTTVGGLDALAFGPSAAPPPTLVPANIPTLSEWAMIVLSLLIVGSVLLLRRR